MKRILIMGINGMLGSMVFQYFNKRNHFEPFGTFYGNNPFPEQINNIVPFNASSDVGAQMQHIIEQFHPDYIINCIGIIKPWCRDDDPVGVKNAIVVNALFPHLLADACAETDPAIKILTIATDCVYSGAKGNYTENDEHDPLDVYGKTKSLGEVRKSNFLNIRTSIIGPELTGKKSLLEWFLSNPDGSTVHGFTHHHWNGLTTLQFAQLCEKIMTEGSFDELRKINHVIHWVENESVNKYELLKIFNEVFGRKINIVAVSNIGEPVDRTLDSALLPVERKPMIDALNSLKDYLI
jgi:dTDP-4-dehydrorhamnose reductase